MGEIVSINHLCGGELDIANLNIRLLFSLSSSLDERPDLSTAELKLKSQKQLKGKKKDKKNRLKSRNASTDKSSGDEHILDSLTNIVITTASQVVSSIRYRHIFVNTFSVNIVTRFKQVHCTFKYIFVCAFLYIWSVALNFALCM